MKLCKNFLFFFNKFILMNKYCHSINSWWHMFKWYAIIFKHLKNFSSKSDFWIHHVFVDAYWYESLLTGNTSNYTIRSVTCCLNNHCTRILWCICISDINRNSFFSYRENCWFMKNGSTHVRQFPKFPVCNNFDWLWIFYYSWVCCKETRNICPVFVHIRFDSSCNYWTCHIRTTSWKCLNFSVWHCTIKSRNYSIFCSSELFWTYFISLFWIEFSIFIKTDYICSINKLISKIICHYNTIKVFSSWSSIIFSCFCFKVFLDCLELFF